MTATVASGPANRTDWLAVYPEGGSTYVSWLYLNGTQSAPATGMAGSRGPCHDATRGRKLHDQVLHRLHAPRDERDNQRHHGHADGDGHPGDDRTRRHRDGGRGRRAGEQDGLARALPGGQLDLSELEIPERIASRARDGCCRRGCALRDCRRHSATTGSSSSRDPRSSRRAAPLRSPPSRPPRR